MIPLDTIIQGDCLEEMKKLPDKSIDAIVTDPPYELAFMGKKWDTSGIAYNVDMWGECLRDVREYRFRHANRAAAKLMREGHIIYSPISHTHPIAVEGDLPLDWAYWQSVDEFYIRLCEKVVVLELNGWQKSEGVRAEIDIARALNKPIEFMGVDA